MAVTLENAPLQLSTSKNPIIFGFDSSNASEVNHRYIMNVTLQNAANVINFNLLDFAVPGQFGKFDLANIIDKFLSDTNFIVPTSAETISDWLDVSGFTIAGLNITIAEDYGLPLVGASSPVGYPFGDFTIYHILRGGFSYPNWPEGKYMYDWLRQSDGVCPFLTWKPKSCMVAVDQPEFLSFIDVTDTVSATKNFVLEATAHFTDGTTATVSSTPYLGNCFKVYRFPVGYQAFNFAGTYPTKTVHHYKVKLKVGGTTISEERTYYVDYQRHLATRYLIFLNSLGGTDTVRFIGTGEFMTDYDRVSSDKYMGKYSNASGTRMVVGITEQAKKKVNTGYINRAEVQWLRDMFLSKEVYALENDVYVPVEIVNKKFSSQMESSLNALVVEYENKFTNEVYTPSRQTVNYIP